MTNSVVHFAIEAEGTIPMTQAEEYRMRAAEVRRRAAQETSPVAVMELEGIAAAYLRLASRADRTVSFSRLKLVVEIRPHI